MQNVHFTPPEIARLIGVNESTVKRWIDKGVLTAQKTPGGHRRVTKSDIQKFVTSYKRVSNKSYVLKRLSNTLDEIDHEPYYRNLLERRYSEAQKMLHQAYVGGMPIVDIVESIIIPTLVDVGEGWRKGVLTIESEHRITFVVRQHLINLEQFVAEPEGKKKPKKILLACVPGDNHELALHILSLSLRSFGYETEALGINISIKELENGVKGYKPDVIALSKVYSEVDLNKTYFTHLEKLAKAHKCKVVVGGGGWAKKELTLLEKNTSYIGRCSSLKELPHIINKK